MSTGSTLEVTTNDDMCVLFLDGSTDLKERFLLWLVRRWMPDFKLARVKRWPYDGTPPSSADFGSRDG